MKQSNNKGFTLIELLVVIAIIGLLSTMAVVSLNSARSKARDASRLSDVKQMSNVLAIQATEGATAQDLEGCTTADAKVSTCTGPGEVSQFSNFVDPSDTDGSASACSAAAGTAQTSVCDYSIDGTETVEDTIIKFWNEEAEEVWTIDANGVIDEG